MSMYGDDEHGCSKNTLYDEMTDFVEQYSAAELLEIVANVLRDQGK